MRFNCVPNLQSFLKKSSAVITFFLPITILLVAVGCTEAEVSGQLLQSESDATTGSSTTDVKKIVTTGPSLTFNNMTGGANAIAIDPVTHLPSISYYDKNSTAGGGTTTLGALKYAYMDAYGSWIVELVDLNYSTTGAIACGTANSFCVGAPNSAAGSVADIISIAFKSTGLPVIAYVYGASSNTTGGYKQVRLAERNSSGIWTITVAATYLASLGGTGVASASTVDPIKGLKLKVDTNDNLHVSYAWYSATISSSAYKHLFRAADGTWTETDLATIVSGGTITAANQGIQQSGLALCTIGGNQFLIATAAVTKGPAGINNQPVVISASVGTTGISSVNTVNVMTACGGACFSTALGANSGFRTSVTIGTDGKPIVGIYSTTNTSLYTATLPNDCASTQPTATSSWGALTSTGTANDGLNGFELAAAGTDHIVGYSRSSTHFIMNQRAASGAFIGPTLVETGVAWAAGEGVGLVYDSLYDIFYLSYAKLPGAAATATGNDVVVASGSTADINGITSSAQFVLNIIDQLSNVFPSTAIPILSAAKASNGKVGYAFLYVDSTAADSKLYYGSVGGTAVNPTFSRYNVVNYIESATGLNVGSYPSLTFDGNNQPIIAYYNPLATEGNLQVARTSNDGITFNIQTVDDTSSTTGLFPSAASSGTSFGISYYVLGVSPQVKALKFARYTPAKGWKKFYVDGTSGVTGSGCSTTADAGKYSKLKFTSTGLPVITYQRDGNLYIAMAAETITSSTFTWTCRQLDSGATNRGEGIDFDLTTTNIPSIVHYDSGFNQIRYVYSDASLENGIASLTFSSEAVAGVGSTLTISQSPQIRVTSDGTKWLSYYSGADQGLVLASKTTNSSSWSTEVIDPNNSGASAPSLAGLYSQLLLNRSEKPLIFYRSRENWLKYFSRENQ